LGLSLPFQLKTMPYISGNLNYKIRYFKYILDELVIINIISINNYF